MNFDFSFVKNFSKKWLRLVFSRQINWFRVLCERKKNKNLSTKSKIIHSAIPGLKSLGEYSRVENSSISGDVQVGDHSAVFQSQISGNVRIGRFTTFNGPDSRIIGGVNGVVIGNFCSIAPGCYIYEINHILDRCSTYYIFRNLIDSSGDESFVWEGDASKDICSKGVVEIGHDVWIGSRSTILSGVKIGDGVVIAANSTIVKNVPPYAIVGGNPARILGFRFDDVIVERLKAIEWWYWSDSKIKRNWRLFEGKLTIQKLDSILD